MVIRFHEILGRESTKRERIYIFIYTYICICVCTHIHTQCIHTPAHTLKALTQTSKMHVFFGTWPTLQCRGCEDMALNPFGEATFPSLSRSLLICFMDFGFLHASPPPSFGLPPHLFFLETQVKRIFGDQREFNWQGMKETNQ